LLGMLEISGAEVCLARLRGDNELTIRPGQAPQQAKDLFAKAAGGGALDPSQGLLSHTLKRGEECVGHIGLWFGKQRAVWTEEMEAFAGVLTAHLGQLRTLETLTEVDRARQEELQLELCLDEILEHAVGVCGFEFATISMANRERDEIRCYRSRNVAPEWQLMTRYRLDEKDIVTHVFETGERKEVRGRWDELFNEKIFKKFAHDKLARVWIPLRRNGDVVGVIEAGCLLSRSDVLLRVENVDELDEFATEAMAKHDGCCHVRALDLIARQMQILLGAEEVCVSVWDGSLCLVDGRAGSGLMSFADFTEREEFLLRLMDAGKEWQEDFDHGGSPVRMLPLQLRGQRGMLSVRQPESDPGVTKGGAWNHLLRRLMALLGGDITRINAWRSLEHSRILAGLRDTEPILAGTRTLEEGLQDIADRALVLLQAKSVLIFDYHGEPQQFGKLRASSGEFQHELCRDLPGDVFSPLFDGKDRVYVPDLPSSKYVLPRKEDGQAQRFAEKEELGSSAMFQLRGGAPSETIGAFFVNHKDPRREFSATYQKESKALAMAAGAVLSAYRLGERTRLAKERSENLREGLREIDEFILANIQGLDRRDVSRIVLRWLMKILDGEVGAVLLSVPGRTHLEFAATEGCDPLPDGMPSNRGVVGEVFASGEARVIPDTDKEPNYRSLREGGHQMGSELAVPLLDTNGEKRGAFNLEHREKGRFSTADLLIARLFASRVVFALRIAGLYKDLNEQINPRIAFGRIAVRLQEILWDLKKSLRFLLVGVTAGESLGFSRALLFLLDESRANLQGVLAVGSPTLKEATSEWDAYRARNEGVGFADRLERLLDSVDRHHEGIRRGKEEETTLSAGVQKLSWQLDQVAGVVKECLDNGATGTIGKPDLSKDWLGSQLQLRIGGDFGARPFWAVPVVADGKTVGVLVVDQGFLDGRESEEPPEEKKRTLEAFAELMALCIETSRLRERVRTETSEYLFHQIRNPINNAITILRDIQKHRQNEPQLQRALAELKSAQWVVGSGKVFADMRLKRDLQSGMRQGPAGDLIGSLQRIVGTQKILHKDTQIECATTPPGLNKAIRWDEQLLEQSILAILNNAIEYTLDNSVQVEVRSGKDGMEIEVSNSCKEHSQQELDECMRERGRGEVGRQTKPSGSGLGLPIAQRIVEAHRGTLTIRCVDKRWRATIKLIWAN